MEFVFADTKMKRKCQLKRQTIRLTYKAYSCEERQMKFGSRVPLLAEFEGKTTILVMYKCLSKVFRDALNNDLENFQNHRK
jgi:hypothetical protein